MPSNLTGISFSRDLSDVSKWDLKSASTVTDLIMSSSISRPILSSESSELRSTFILESYIFTWSLIYVVFLFLQIIFKENIWDEVDTW